MLREETSRFLHASNSEATCVSTIAAVVAAGEFSGRLRIDKGEIDCVSVVAAMGAALKGLANGTKREGRHRVVGGQPGHLESPARIAQRLQNHRMTRALIAW